MKHVAKINAEDFMKNCFTMDGGGKRLVRPFKRKELCECIGCVLSEVNYAKKLHKIWSEIKKLLVGWHLINYEEMFTETPIYTMYVVINIVIFTSILAIEVFRLTQLCSFLGCFLEYLTLFLPYRFAGISLTRFN